MHFSRNSTVFQETMQQALSAYCNTNKYRYVTKFLLFFHDPQKMKKKNN